MTAGETAPPWYEPHYEGSPVVWGPQGAACGVHGRHTFEARAGHHLAPALLSSGHDIFEELDREYTLVALGRDPRIPADFQEAARELRMPLRVITDTFDGPRAAYQHPFLLIRPDQYVAWAGDEASADATDILRKVIGDHETDSLT